MTKDQKETQEKGDAEEQGSTEESKKLDNTTEEKKEEEKGEDKEEDKGEEKEEDKEEDKGEEKEEDKEEDKGEEKEDKSEEKDNEKKQESTQLETEKENEEKKEETVNESESQEEVGVETTESCLENSPNSKCLSKNIQEKTAHLLSVFDNLYSPIELICSQSESVCTQILDSLNKFEDFRPKSKRSEFTPVMKNKVEEIAREMERIGVDKLEIIGQDQIDLLDDRIWEIVETIKQEFIRNIEDFESKEDMLTELNRKATFLLKMVIVNFYLEEYLPNQKKKFREDEGQDIMEGKVSEGESKDEVFDELRKKVEDEGVSEEKGDEGLREETKTQVQGKTSLVQMDLNEVNLMELIKSINNLSKTDKRK
jgi:hypothetical protein